MDPADTGYQAKTTDELCQALASQGALVGHHDTVLREALETLRNLSVNVQRIGTQVELLTSQAFPPQHAAQPTAPPPPPAALLHQLREAVIPTPERYAGDLGNCRAFLFQCTLVFEQQPSTYHTDGARVAYVMSLLRGRALDWATAVRESQPHICWSYDTFISEMKKVFDHPVRGRDASRRLLSLRQGSRSVAEFSVEFRTVASDSRWNNESLQDAFLQGLNEAINDELAARDDPGSLDNLIATAIKIDNRLRERRRDRTSRHSNPSDFSLDPQIGTATTPIPRFFPTPYSASSHGDEPMQVGRARLSPSERARRIHAGECVYCSQTSHLVSSCPSLPKGQARQ